jgi:hypothetical protein
MSGDASSDEESDSDDCLRVKTVAGHWDSNCGTNTCGPLLVIWVSVRSCNKNCGTNTCGPLLVIWVSVRSFNTGCSTC